MRNTLLPAAVGLTLAIVGWLIGHHAVPPQELRRDTEAAAVTPAVPDSTSAERGRDGAEGRHVDRARWESAINRCLAEPSSAKRLHLLYEPAQAFDLSDFPAIIGALRGKADDRGLSGELLEIWAERDVAGARAWCMTQPVSERLGFFDHVAEAWVHVDALGMRDWLRDLPKEDRNILLPKIPESGRWMEGSRPWLQAIIDRNPEAALDLLEVFPDGEQQMGYAMGAFAKRDPVAAAARTLALPNGSLAKMYAFNSLLGAWLEADRAAAMEWAERVGDPQIAERAREVQSWGASSKVYESQAEFETVLGALTGVEREKMLQSQAYSLAVSAPDKALAMADRAASPASRAKIIERVLVKMNANGTDPVRAAQVWLAESTQAGHPLAWSRETLGGLAEASGVNAAVQLVLQLPENQLKDASQKLAEAVGWQAVGDAARQWPPGARREEWLRQTVSGLLRDGDVSAAQQFVARLPAGPEQEGAVRTIGTTLFSEDPDAGAQTLLRLADGRAVLRESVQHWLETDAAEARRWIGATRLLDAGEKGALLTPSTTPSR